MFRLVKVSYKSLSNIWNRDFDEARTRLCAPDISITITRTSTTGISARHSRAHTAHLSALAHKDGDVSASLFVPATGTIGSLAILVLFTNPDAETTSMVSGHFCRAHLGRGCARVGWNVHAVCIRDVMTTGYGVMAARYRRLARRLPYCWVKRMELSRPQTFLEF